MSFMEAWELVFKLKCSSLTQQSWKSNFRKGLDHWQDPGRTGKIKSLIIFWDLQKCHDAVTCGSIKCWTENQFGKLLTRFPPFWPGLSIVLSLTMEMYTLILNTPQRIYKDFYFEGGSAVGGNRGRFLGKKKRCLFVQQPGAWAAFEEVVFLNKPSEILHTTDLCPISTSPQN